MPLYPQRSAAEQVQRRPNPLPAAVADEVPDLVHDRDRRSEILVEEPLDFRQAAATSPTISSGEMEGSVSAPPLWLKKLAALLTRAPSESGAGW